MKGKTVIITGASSGIGMACAQKFAKEGCNIVLAARNAEALYSLEDELKKQAVNVLAVPTDVSNEEDCKQLIEKTVNRFKKIDILINNAGISMRALFSEVEIKVIRQLMEVNFFGTLYCSKYALPYLLQAKGSLVGVTSIAGYHGLPGRTGYSASKFAMHGLLETIRIENLKNGLHVMICAPGFTASNVRYNALTADGSPQGVSPRKENKMMQPYEVANAIYKGIKHKKRNIILTFEGKLTILSQRIIPHILDKVFYFMFKNEPDSPIK